MKLGVYKRYELDVYGDLDINIEDYVDWLGKEVPTRENLQKFIEEELDFDYNISIITWDNLDYEIDSLDNMSFSGAVEYKLLLNEAEKLQNELKAENRTLE